MEVNRNTTNSFSGSIPSMTITNKSLLVSFLKSDLEPFINSLRFLKLYSSPVVPEASIKIANCAQYPFKITQGNRDIIK